VITKEFVLAGKAVFTIEIPEAFAAQYSTPPHYTFRVRHKKANGNYGEAWFVMLLTGPDNTSDYTYVGMLDRATGQVNLTRASQYDEGCMAVRLFNRVTARLWANEGDKIEAAGFKLHHEGKCCRCGRKLTVPASIESGIGPECAAMVNAA
jgi:hypothetical protein